MVRAWCLPVQLLNRQRLLGQHVECHVMFNANMRGGGGYYNHPQTKRFRDDPGQLVSIHNACVEEMKARGYNHKSPIDYPESPYSYTKEEYGRDLEILRERQPVDLLLKVYQPMNR